MKKYISCVALLIVLNIIKLNAQDYKEFKIKIPQNTKVENSLYNKIEFIDSRSFDNYLGFVQTKLFNEYTPIVDKPSIEQQFEDLFEALNPTKKGHNTIVVLLRRLYFSEATKKTAEYGYCHVRFNVYQKGEYYEYFPINEVDTVITLKTWTDVTNNLLKKTSDLFVQSIAASLTKEPTSSNSYKNIDVLNVAFFEKAKKPLYGMDALKDGIYPDFNSFLNQTPISCNIVPQFRGNLIESFVANDLVTGKEIKINNKDIYAIVVNRKGYVANYKCFVPIYWKDGDFRFVNKGTVKNTTFYYPQAALISPDAPKKKKNLKTFLSNDPFPQTAPNDSIIMTIDHLTGEYIPTPENASLYFYIK